MILTLLAAITFHADMEPLLERHCQSCHRPGEIGPMPLLTCEQVSPWAKAIRQAVALKTMPPWFAVQGGPFLHERRLSEQEVQTSGRWADEGAPRGAQDPAQPGKL